MLGLFTPTADSVDALQGSEMLQSAINSMGKNAATFRFLSVDAKCQQEFVQYFGIQDHEVPTVVIYSPSKRRYQLLKGSFTEVKSNKFIPIDSYPLFNFY